jgi:hypothetical protein
MSRTFNITAALCMSALFALGCEDGAVSKSGLDEPLRVAGAQFIRGALPHDGGGPKVLTVDSQNNGVVVGATGKKLGGSAEGSAAAIGFQLAGIGTGYWSVPIGAADPQTPGVMTWDATMDYARTIPLGKRDLDLVAIDAAGNFGPLETLPLTFLSNVPEGKVVISLLWDADADLDLHLVTPSGKELDPKHPTTLSDAGADPASPGTGLLDRDSNSACAIDGYRREDIVFADDPLPGFYLIRVDMFASCGVPATSFVVEIRRDGQLLYQQAGRLLDIDADGGGAGSGLFVAEPSF